MPSQNFSEQHRKTKDLRITVDYDYNVCIIAFWNTFCWRLNTKTHSKIHINLFLKMKIFYFSVHL